MANSSSDLTSTTPMSLVEAGIHALRSADQIGDADAMGKLLAPDVVFRSPLASSVRFEGREEVVALHRDVFAILEDRDSTEPLVSDTMGCFNFSARVRGTPIDGIAFATFNEQGQISELKVLARPMVALAALFSALPPRVSRRRAGPVRSFITARGAGPFSLLARFVEKAGPFLIPAKGATPTP